MKLKNHLFTLSVLALLLNACALPTQPETQIPTPVSQTPVSPKKGSTYFATVIKVADGDTITVQDQHGGKHKIRLAYIDAPETKQNHGQHSQAALENWLQNKMVRVKVEDIDRYKREVALIQYQQHDVNYCQIAEGHAWHYTDYAKTQLADDFTRYQAAMQAAKVKQLGLWAFARPQAPWDYRRQQRQKNQTLE